MNKKKKNIAFIPLMTVTFLVWGIIIYKVIDHFKSSNDRTSEIITNIASVVDPVNRNSVKNDVIETEYVSLDRDPFVLKRIMKVNDNVGQNKQLNQSTFPRLKPIIKTEQPQIKFDYVINGVIINEESKLVILEDITNKKIIFMRVEDKYKDIVIKSIDVNKIVLNENGILKDIEIKKLN